MKWLPQWAQNHSAKTELTTPAPQPQPPASKTTPTPLVLSYNEAVEHAQRIENGMTTQQVIDLLGEPQHKGSTTCLWRKRTSMGNSSTGTY